MNVKRMVVCAALGLMALPAAASAQIPVPPPDGDNYLAPLFLNDNSSGNAIPYDSPFGFTADTSTYTVQDDMFAPPGSGGPREPQSCENSNGVVSPYGNTIWSVFYAHRWGIMRIETAGPFDGVIGIVPFNSPNDPEPLLQFGTCFDELGGFEEEAGGLVAPGNWYAVQVGGTGTPQGGQVQVKYQLSLPPQAEGRAFLFWKTGPLRITDLYIKNVPAGHRVEVRCTKGACKRDRINVRRKPVAGKMKTDAWSPAPGLEPVRMKGFAGDGGPSANPMAFKPLATAAQKRVNVLKNKRVTRGAKIEVRITQTGYIGRYYRWKVKSNEITSAKTFCMNPGSRKPRKRCSG
jgi:hypothetical protein